MDNLTIIISVLTILIALGSGLYLRRILVRRLQKTVLDNWLIQLLGIIVFLPPVIIGFVLFLRISGLDTQVNVFYQWLLKAFHVPSLPILILNLISSILIILLAIGVGRTLMKLVTRGIAKSGLEINIRILIGRILNVVVAIIALFSILFVWGFELTVPATVISILTVGIAFVFQDLLKNIVAGVYILMEGPFQIGDTISTDQYTGKVKDVQLRATKLYIGTGDQVIVPNSFLFSGIVINKTTYDERRVTIAITMPQEEYEQDTMAECILKAIKEVNGVMLKSEPTLSLSSVAGSFEGSTGTVSGYAGEIITLILRFWTREGDDSALSDAMHALHTALPRADLAIREPVGL